jgi:hypothetical protein
MSRGRRGIHINHMELTLPVTRHGIHCKDGVYNMAVSTLLPDHMEKLIVTGLASYTRRLRRR